METEKNAHGVHEFNDVGWIPSVVDHVWDVNPIIDEGSGVGQILKALVGYNGNPSLTEVVAYAAYWAVVLAALWLAWFKSERGQGLAQAV